MQKVISENKEDAGYQLRPAIPYSNPEKVLDLKYKTSKYFSVINAKSCRRQRLFLNKHWDEEIIKWKGESVPEYDSVLIVNMPYDSSYCHNLIDTMPLAFYHESSKEYDLILLANNKFLNKFVKDLKIRFQKVGIIDNEFSFKAKYVKVENYSMRSRDIRRLDNFKCFLEFYKENALKVGQQKGRSLIYCTRNSGGGASHGRQMHEANETEIRAILKDYASKNNMDYVLFDGKKNGETMSPIDQIKLFHSAKVIVGPHGGAMANVIHIDPKNECKICEFTSGTETDGLKIQAIRPFVKNYNRLYNNMISDFSDYFFIPFEKNSTKNKTKINVNNLKIF